MGKNTKKIRAGIKNPNNKSQAKAARSFIANRWWVEYKNTLLAMAVLAISIFSATIFLNVKNEGKQILFLNPHDDRASAAVLDVLVPTKESNHSYVILCHEHDNLQIDKIWEKMVYSPELLEKDISVKGAVSTQQSCRKFFRRALLNFATNVATVRETVAEAFWLDMNQASPISFVVSYRRKPLQLESNYFTPKIHFGPHFKPSSMLLVYLNCGL